MPSIIINADDYGLKESCTLAICEAFCRNYITDTTMCANGEYFDEAIDIARNHGFFDKIGIHFNITEGMPLTEDIKNDRFFCDENGCFRDTLNRYRPLTKRQKTLLFDELEAQVLHIKSKGVLITHADSHHHIHTGPFIFPVVAKVMKKNGIKKLRPHRNVGEISMVKLVWKRIYNYWAEKICGLTVVDYFCDYQDLACLKNCEYAVAELMVHPEYSENGYLVNRTEYEGSPKGELMENVYCYVKKEVCNEFNSYGRFE